jgi:hypothetical protein
MRRMISGIFVAAILSAAGLAQDQPSLGDIARANREKQQAQESAGTVPKVITNKDLPASARAGIPEENPDDPMTTVSGVQHSNYSDRDRPYQDGGQRYGERPFGRPGFDGSRGGENLRGQIEAQENRINELQARIDRANQMMHPNGSTVQYEGPMNGRQAMQAQRVEMMEQMLDQQKQRLAAMQDTARREGMHTQVSDP